MLLAQNSGHSGIAHLVGGLTRRRSQIGLGLVFALAITIGAIAQTVAAERSVTDASGRTIAIDNPQRIVSIGGAITEIIFALGAGDRVIARDSTSFYPPEANKKPDVGYMRALSAEGVLSVKPDLIIAVEGSGPKEVVDLLEAASVPMVLVPETYSVDGIVGKIRMVATIIGEEQKGEALASKVEARFVALKTALDKLPPDQRKRAIFLMSLASGKPMAAGSHTAADAAIKLAGAINPMEAVEGYKPASDEAIAAAAPQAVIMMSRPGAEATKPETIFATPALSATPAARSQSLFVVDGLSLLGFGPRTADAAIDLAHALYPDLVLPETTTGN